MGRKIVVIGQTCSGKTTLAEILAERLGVPHVELDALHHGPNWREASADELRAALERELAGLDGWVADGGYMSKLGTWLIDQADTIVWLDLPLPTLTLRLWRRTRERIRTGVELWNPGNRETWSGGWELFSFAVRNHRRRRREWPLRFEGGGLVRLRSPDEVRRWLAGLD